MSTTSYSDTRKAQQPLPFYYYSARGRGFGRSRSTPLPCRRPERLSVDRAIGRDKEKETLQLMSSQWHVFFIIHPRSTLL